MSKEIIYSMMGYKGYYVPKTNCYELYNVHKVIVVRYDLNKETKELFCSAGMDFSFSKIFDSFLRDEGVIA